MNNEKFNYEDKMDFLTNLMKNYFRDCCSIIDKDELYLARHLVETFKGFNKIIDDCLKN